MASVQESVPAGDDGGMGPLSIDGIMRMMLPNVEEAEGAGDDEEGGEGTVDGAALHSQEFLGNETPLSALDAYAQRMFHGGYTRRRAELSALVLTIPQLSEETRRLALSVYPGPLATHQDQRTTEKEERRRVRREKKAARREIKQHDAAREEFRRRWKERLERRSAKGIAGIWRRIRLKITGVFGKS